VVSNHRCDHNGLCRYAYAEFENRPKEDFPYDSRGKRQSNVSEQRWCNSVGAIELLSGEECEGTGRTSRPAQRLDFSELVFPHPIAWTHRGLGTPTVGRIQCRNAGRNESWNAGGLIRAFSILYPTLRAVRQTRTETSLGPRTTAIQVCQSIRLPGAPSRQRHFRQRRQRFLRRDPRQSAEGMPVL
jgi:hypothetical protein